MRVTAWPARVSSLMVSGTLLEACNAASKASMSDARIRTIDPPDAGRTLEAARSVGAGELEIGARLAESFQKRIECRAVGGEFGTGLALNGQCDTAKRIRQQRFKIRRGMPLRAQGSAVRYEDREDQG